MKDQTQSAIKLLEALTERAKELTCLYAIEETFREPDTDIDHVCDRIVNAIPPGWQFPDICVAKIVLEDKEYVSRGFEETAWKLTTNIVQHDRDVGMVGVYYTRETPSADIGPFLKEEKKLIETIADRINHFLTYKKMTNVFQEWQVADREMAESGKGDWEAVLDLIRQTDNALFLRLSNKMLNHLCWSGIDEAETLRRDNKRKEITEYNVFNGEARRSLPRRPLDFSTELTERIFRIAAGHLSSDEILSRVQMWMQEDKLGALLRTVRRHLPHSEITGGLRRYFLTTPEDVDSRYPLARGLKVLLIECLLTGRMEYISLAKDIVDIEDLFELFQNVICSAESHGKLGGESANLFLASQILKKTKGEQGSNSPFRIPKTWYISSDMMLDFIHYNNMDEIVEQKYKDIERVRFEYPHVIETFRQMVHSPEMINGLSTALDTFGDSPVVVRSSSLLEGRTGTAFVNKHKTVFLGNQGTREERLRDLMRAVAEVYAANFGPDPIERRSECGLVEFSEQMGVMIQEVVGTRVGPYFLPVYSGVARSRNDFRWLPGITSEDGMVRIIPGLGTRASERTEAESPVFIVPGQPSTQLNGSPSDRFSHAPKSVDVISLETNHLETLEMSELIMNFGEEYPEAEQVVSVCKDGKIESLDTEKSEHEKENLVVTFDGLITKSPFVSQIRNLLRMLDGKLGLPVEIEFASDGENIYLLRCCPQTITRVPRPAPIPKDITRDELVFSANRYISNGWISNITHIVYLNPRAYEALEDPGHRKVFAKAVEKLNDLLPKKQFVLIRPGRSSSHTGKQTDVDIKFENFKNAAVLVDVFQPETIEADAFTVGINFLQDLMESGIKYLPLFSDDEDTGVNERFLLGSQNVLPELLPDYEFLADVLRVIDVPKSAEGKIVQVLMNAELGEAVGVLADTEQEIGSVDEGKTIEDEHPENYWRWRYLMAEQIASQMDLEEFGVEGVYLFGSTKNGTAGPASDIDILIHFGGTAPQREGLVRWLEGWSLCLDEINYLRTGYRSGGLLDFHLITNDDIANKNSYASKINAITDAARPLKIKNAEDRTKSVTGGNIHESGKGTDK